MLQFHRWVYLIHNLFFLESSIVIDCHELFAQVAPATIWRVWVVSGRQRENSAAQLGLRAAAVCEGRVGIYSFILLEEVLVKDNLSDHEIKAIEQDHHVQLREEGNHRKALLRLDLYCDKVAPLKH